MRCIWCSSQSESRRCSSCNNLYKNLQEDPSTITSVHPGLSLRVEYRVSDRSHDGYCSDHTHDQELGNFEEEVTHLTCEYPVPRFFIRSNFDSDKNLIKFRRFYEKKPTHNKNGWCIDCATHYDIVSIQLVQSIEDLPTSRSK